VEKAHQQRIKHFLKKLSYAVNQNQVYIDQRKKKNNDTLAKLNLPNFEAVKILKRLKIHNYIDGPKPDTKGRPGEIWVFKIDIVKMALYIKMLAPEKDKVGPINCLSFHEDFMK